MDQQKPNPSAHVPTEAEIARLEAEAVAALRPDAPQGDPAEEKPAAPSFVPYVDDVPDQKAEPATATDGGENAEDDDEYIPGEWEKRIDALTPAQWKRWQIAGGAAVGLAAIGSLVLFGEELSTYGLAVAVLLALLLPRYLERAWRRRLDVGRKAMLIAMIVGLAAMVLVIGLRTGFTFKPAQ